jgi:thiol:disulfide interchange protein
MVRLSSIFNKLIFLCLFLSFETTKAVQVDELINVSILSDSKTIQVGGNANIILKIELKDEWHIYSKNAGENGYPTTIKWNFSEGVSIEETIFPDPVVYNVDGSKSFIHSGTLFLKTQFKLDSIVDSEESSLSVGADFSALVCSEENCIPYDKTLELEIPISDETIIDEVVTNDLIATSSMEPTLQRVTPSVSASIESDLNQLFLMFGLILVAMGIWAFGKTRDLSNSPNFNKFLRVLSICGIVSGVWIGFPVKSDDLVNQINWESWSPAKQEQLHKDGKPIFIDFTARWCASCQINKRIYQKKEVIAKFENMEIAALQADWTKRGPVILEALQSYGREGVPLYVYYPPSKIDQSDKDYVILPEILSEKILLDAMSGKDSFFQIQTTNFWAILGFGFLGGIILNLMPCVFPVIGLKIMSFVKQSGEDPRKIRFHGVIFTAGVVLSFWLLVGFLLAIRESLGADVGWGFQLQEPMFVFILAVFLLIFALSLSGVFEMGLSVTGIGGQLSQKSGYAGSFFSGFLATVVATPCMAPFLGVAVGAALTMNWVSSLTIFTSIALGLSAPYLILSIFPKWISRLPKPGKWMDTLKQAMAFPLYATVAWLIWTLNSLI